MIQEHVYNIGIIELTNYELSWPLIYKYFLAKRTYEIIFSNLWNWICTIIKSGVTKPRFFWLDSIKYSNFIWVVSSSPFTKTIYYNYANICFFFIYVCMSATHLLLISYILNVKNLRLRRLAVYNIYFTHKHTLINCTIINMDDVCRMNFDNCDSKEKS